jgi:hypothetical protein
LLLLVAHPIHPSYLPFNNSFPSHCLLTTTIAIKALDSTVDHYIYWCNGRRLQRSPYVVTPMSSFLR